MMCQSLTVHSLRKTFISGYASEILLAIQHLCHALLQVVDSAFLCYQNTHVCNLDDAA